MLIKLRKMMKREEGQKGFTLVELIIVMAILAILAALAIPKFGTVLSNAKSDANTQNHELITNAADLYVSSMTATTSDADLESALIDTLDSTHVLVNSNYLKSAPKPPTSGSNYSITAANVDNGNLVTLTITP